MIFSMECNILLRFHSDNKWNQWIVTYCCIDYLWTWFALVLHWEMWTLLTSQGIRCYPNISCGTLLSHPSPWPRISPKGQHCWIECEGLAGLETTWGLCMDGAFIMHSLNVQCCCMFHMCIWIYIVDQSMMHATISPCPYVPHACVYPLYACMLCPCS